MGNPDAILLDEPTEGLAPVIVAEMAIALQRMKAEGIAVLLSEQNLKFASAVADRAYIIAKGQVRHQGPMAELAADAGLRQAHPGLSGATPALGVGRAKLRLWPKPRWRWRFKPAPAPPYAAAAEAHGATIGNLSPGPEFHGFMQQRLECRDGS